MTINRNNFEAYLLDYLEGNLDPLLTADLMAFLAENPEYESYIPEYDTRIALNGNHEYHQKNRLKKDFADVPEITLVNFDEFCIASCEGLLGDADLKRLSDFIASHPEKRKEYDLYTRIKLQPDTSVVFADKALLKKHVAFVLKPRFLYYAMGIAASFALLLMLVSKKPAESAYTYTQSGAEKVRVPAITPVHTAPAIEYAKQEVQQTHQPVKNNIKATPAEAGLPEMREIATEYPVLNPIVSIGAQGVLTAAINSSTDFSRMNGVIQSDENLGFLATVDPELSETNESLLRSLFSRVDFWRTAEKAIQGFNYLTEANLDIDKTLDENGRLSGILLNTDSYKISGNKIK
ncbi:MAG: hypothetical protein JXA72_04670 [Bacteroidales bacterium]|nr:hypothetical protein [Bacteroidales bacterium]